MTNRSERTHIVEVLGNVMSSGKDDASYLEVYLDNKMEYAFRVEGAKLIKIDTPAPSSCAIGCGFAIYTESAILGHGILKEIHIIIDKHTFPGSEMKQLLHFNYGKQFPYFNYVFQNPTQQISKN